jgi:hypothetical protein
LGTYTAIPSSFPRFRSTVEVIVLNAVEYRLRFPLDVRCCRVPLAISFGCQTLFQNVPSVSCSVWETKRNYRGPSSESREDGER